VNDALKSDSINEYKRKGLIDGRGNLIGKMVRGAINHGLNNI
jgi:hypothetical protein